MTETQTTMLGDATESVPAVYQSQLSLDELAEVFADIEQCAELISVSLRGARDPGDADGEVSLLAALAKARDGSVGAIQVRYRHHDELWIDTISLGSPDTCVLIRTRLDR